MDRMEFNDFLLEVTKNSFKSRNERYGQVFFNTLESVRPDLADEIRGTSLDPYYLTGKDAMLMDSICRYLESSW